MLAQKTRRRTFRKRHRPLVRLNQACYDLHQRTLATAVDADDPQAVAFIQRQVHAAEHRIHNKGLGNAGKRQKGHGVLLEAYHFF